MRNLATLVIGAIALTVTSQSLAINSACAQDSSSFNGNGQGAGMEQQESVTFVLELDDHMIETLRSGKPLTSLIPLRLRDKVSEVKLRYVGGNQTADRTNDFQSSRNNGSSGMSNFPSNNANSGLGQQGQGGLQGQGASRLDSNRGGSASNLPDSNNSTNPLPPRRSTVPRFTPDSTFDSSSNQGSSMVPTRSRNSTERLGPPNPFSDTRDPFATQENFPARNEGTSSGISPHLPASTHSRPGSYQPPRQPTDTRVQPRNAQGSEFDTVQNSQFQNRQFQPETRPSYQDLPSHQSVARSAQGQHSLQPAYPNDRVAANDFQNQYRSTDRQPRSGYQTAPSSYQPDNSRFAGSYESSLRPRTSLVNGHDVPMIRNQIPRTAARPSFDSNAPSNNFTASIPGTPTNNDAQIKQNDGSNGTNANAPVAQLNKFNEFLYFLLLCSIGLNIYLAWISRGFYVRYRELADELRDTFSTAV